MHNTEEKGWWTQHGVRLEHQFVTEVAPQLGLDVEINPTKATNPFVPDLLLRGNIADLKTQNTPFFTAQRFGIDPQFAVTFNRKDYLRYAESYPDLTVLFWVDWTTTEWPQAQPRIRIKKMWGVWEVAFAELVTRIVGGRTPLHTYQRRGGDRLGNATESYLFDLRTLTEHACHFA